MTDRSEDAVSFERFLGASTPEVAAIAAQVAQGKRSVENPAGGRS